jgi:hypothetical protein
MGEVSVNWAAVLVGAVAHFLLGGLWYSPVLFAKPFIRATGKTEEELRENARPALYGVAALGSLVKALAFVVLLDWIGDVSFAQGVMVAVLVGVALHGAAVAVSGAFESRNRVLAALDVGYETVGLVVIASIVIAMR